MSEGERARGREMLLGAIADDFTGASDLASTLVRAGLRTVLTIGVPGDPGVATEPDAVVVGLKSRTIPAPEAVAGSLAALRWLRAAGARQVYFKYCSTFDSTDAGNIGPVADALLDELGEPFTIACPALPENGRTIYQGHLFVGSTLLSESPMRDHPLTPMTDSNLVRVLGRQTRRKVGLIEHRVVRQGPPAIRDRMAALRGAGFAYAVVDALADEDLLAIGAACHGLRLVTGGSGVAAGLPQNLFHDGGLTPREDAAVLPAAGGRAGVLAGSCSAATREQVAVMASRHLAHAVDPLADPDPDPVTLAERALTHVGDALEGGRPFLIYSTADPIQVARVQETLGPGRAARLVEETFALVARRLVERGVRRLVVAGGETAGAVVQALGVRALAIGPAVDPGVPVTVTVGTAPRLALVLKSGNFGTPGFFEKALARMP